MKKYLLPHNGRFYKANLHCHTTISDGKLTPEQVKAAYKGHGYCVVAFTDHDVMIPHPELADEDFLPLNGYEMEIDEDPVEGRNWRRLCHFCLIALDPDNLKQVCYHRTKYLFSNAVNFRDQIRFDESLPDYERVYSGEGISDMMQKGREGGFFVTYNHPAWSLEDMEQYGHYHGMHAMEICNYGCLAAGYPDYNEAAYDQMLRGGERIYCIAADDNHNAAPLDSRRSDSFGGFTMIKAEKLEYKTITDALLAGHFYASQGPLIHALWYEDGRIHITCSDADRIYLNAGFRTAESRYAQDGAPLNAADFEVKPHYNYVRITVVDRHGNRANTNAYFVDELLAAAQNVNAANQEI